MVSDVIESLDFKNLMIKQIKEMIYYLLGKNSEFAITVNINGATFNPNLPSSIEKKLSKFSLFVLSNYTYTTIKVDDEIISFEAGFGSENFGSTVTIPLESIFQIVIEDSILLINPVATVEKFNNNSKVLLQKSKNIFKNNPKNLDLIK
jgi:CO dehydrogenase/acetyl-CoA synthase beta subunit